MSEKRILIASLLKPVNDTRMYEKLGLSLSKLNGTRVHICGFAAPAPVAAPTNVFFHPLFSFKRLSINRFSAQLSYYRLIQSLKPDLIIACTHELLLISYFYCRKYNAKLVYDVQENYSLNLRKQNNYNTVLKKAFAFGVESIEKFVAPAVAHFILAEKSYASELRFLQNRYTILENKYKKPGDYEAPPTPVSIKSRPLRLLYSGTIAEEYGILEAVKLTEQFYGIDHSTTLDIIGYCANTETWKKLQQAVKGKKYITVTGGKELVPHADIINVMRQCNVGLLPYRSNESIFNCIPTKLYEYVANALPILISHNLLWHEIVQQQQAGLSVDFENIHTPVLIKQLRQHQFYTAGIPRNIFWDEEEKRLQQLIAEVLQGTQ